MQTGKINFLYILPNLFTAASIFLGVVSILSAAAGQYEKAAWLIIIATLFDGLDGRVARMTNTQSRFGAEFDSLADVIAFGAAPAFLLFFSYGQEFGKFGVLVAALYLIFGAIRLARFNVISSETEANVFIGLPIPASAIFVVSWILVFEAYPELAGFAFGLTLMTLLAGVLMVTNVRYPSFKKVDMSRSFFVRALVVLIVLLSMVFLFPIEALCVVSSLFLFYGLGRYLYTIITRKNIKASHG